MIDQDPSPEARKLTPLSRFDAIWDTVQDQTAAIEDFSGEGINFEGFLKQEDGSLEAVVINAREELLVPGKSPYRRILSLFYMDGRHHPAMIVDSFMMAVNGRAQAEANSSLLDTFRQVVCESPIYRVQKSD